METVVRARDLTKRYGAQVAVEGLTLEVPAGSMVGIVGPSGSGKTTTVRMLMGTEAPSEGDVLVFGTSPWAFTPAQRERIGYMPQLPVLYPHLSLQENLQFVASVYGLPLRRRERLREVLDFVELTEHRRKLMREASGGMQRRLALAATLVHHPDLLFLDEPTSGIGPIQRRKFWDHFADLKRAGRTLVVTTQYVGDASYCDLVAVLLDGTLLAFDTPDALRREAFGGEVVSLTALGGLDASVPAALRNLSFVHGVSVEPEHGGALHVLVDDAETALPRLREWFASRSIHLHTIGHHHPPFDEVFVKLVERARNE